MHLSCLEPSPSNQFMPVGINLKARKDKAAAIEQFMLVLPIPEDIAIVACNSCGIVQDV